MIYNINIIKSNSMSSKIITINFKDENITFNFSKDFLNNIKFFKNILDVFEEKTIIDMTIPWSNDINQSNRIIALQDYFTCKQLQHNYNNILNNRIYLYQLPSIKRCIKNIKEIYIQKYNDFMLPFKDVVLVTQKEIFDMPKDCTDSDILEAYCYYYLGDLYFKNRFIKNEYTKKNEDIHPSKRFEVGSHHTIRLLLRKLLQKMEQKLIIIEKIDGNFELILKNFNKIISNPYSELKILIDYFLDDANI